MSAALDSGERLQAALAALQGTRAALRRELLPDEEDMRRRADERRQAGAGGRSLDGWRWWRRLRRSARRSPWINMATQSALRWWQQQPWHESSRLLSREVLSRGRPLVRRHPLTAVTLGALAGAALVASRPWRWSWVKAPLRALPAHATGWLVAQLSSASVQAALAGMLLGGLRAAANEPDAEGPVAGEAAAGAAVQAGEGANTRSR